MAADRLDTRPIFTAAPSGDQPVYGLCPGRSRIVERVGTAQRTSVPRFREVP